MNSKRLRGAILFVILIYSSSCCTADASSIHYSWSGTIVPNGSSDPWLIGQQGQSFSLSGVAPESATDLLNDSVQFSTFNLTSAALVVGGQQVSYVDNGYIDFTDNSGNGIIDVVLMGGEFQWFGTKIGIASAVALNPSTFSFTQVSELLPVFPSTTNVDRATCCGDTYTSIVEAGSVVTVVPEPAVELLCFVASILLAGTRGFHDFAIRNSQYIGLDMERSYRINSKGPILCQSRRSCHVVSCMANRDLRHDG